jgi:histidinol-phosphatase
VSSGSTGAPAAPGDLEAWHAFAHELADLVDPVSLPAFEAHAFDVERKADGTAVTEVDRGVERTLRSAIRARFPGHAVLGEEDGLDGPDHAPRWVIDPIDGTTNFVKGNPIWATLIALQVDGEEVVGLASAPALGSRWSGFSGGGAFRDGRGIQVSSVDRLADAEVSLGGLGYFHRDGRGDVVRELARRTSRQRGYGDFWQHCLVAAGSTDAALEAEVNLWDLAAVRCIVEAAGGRFTSLDGAAGAGHGSALASNGLLHEQLLELIASPS